MLTLSSYFKSFKPSSSSLDFSVFAPEEKEIVAKIKSVAQLETFSYYNAQFQEPIISTLATYQPNLRVLNLTASDLSNSNLEQVTNLQKLETIILARCRNLRREHVDCLAHLPSLKSIYINQSTIDDTCAIAFKLLPKHIHVVAFGMVNVRAWAVFADRDAGDRFSDLIALSQRLILGWRYNSLHVCLNPKISMHEFRHLYYSTSSQKNVEQFDLYFPDKLGEKYYQKAVFHLLLDRLEAGIEDLEELKGWTVTAALELIMDIISELDNKSAYSSVYSRLEFARYVAIVCLWQYLNGVDPFLLQQLSKETHRKVQNLDVGEKLLLPYTTQRIMSSHQVYLDIERQNNQRFRINVYDSSCERGRSSKVFVVRDISEDRFDFDFFRGFSLMLINSLKLNDFYTALSQLGIAESINYKRRGFIHQLNETCTVQGLQKMLWANLSRKMHQALIWEGGSKLLERFCQLFPKGQRSELSKKVLKLADIERQKAKR